MATIIDLLGSIHLTNEVLKLAVTYQISLLSVCQTELLEGNVSMTHIKRDNKSAPTKEKN